jgi:hypothetical protein
MRGVGERPSQGLSSEYTSKGGSNGGEYLGDGASPSYSAGLEFELTGVAQSVELA